VSFSERQAKLSLRVYPSAISNEVMGFADGALRLKISAPPTKGKANKELITFLSQKLGVGKSSLTIIKGHTSRNKVIAIDGLSQEEAMRRLLSS
jgi:uncharacterized protein (TIGR00251 family)